MATGREYGRLASVAYESENHNLPGWSVERWTEGNWYGTGFQGGIEDTGSFGRLNQRTINIYGYVLCHFWTSLNYVNCSKFAFTFADAAFLAAFRINFGDLLLFP